MSLTRGIQTRPLLMSKVIFIACIFCTLTFSYCSKNDDDPTTPKQFSFATEEVEFTNGSVKLSGILYLPLHDGQLPAIAVTHGSGREGKSQEGYISLAGKFAQAGYAVLIYDKRGVGQSEGEYIETPDMNIPAGDLAKAVGYLMSRKEIDKKRIGVYGHSQGGWVAPLAAVSSADISFVIVSCGGGVSIRETVLYNLRFQLQPFQPKDMDAAIDMIRTLYTYLATGDSYSSTAVIYEQMVKESWFTLLREMGFTDKLPPPSLLNDPVFDFFRNISYDPQSTLQSLSKPAFVLLAEKDELVPTEQAKLRWQQAFEGSDRNSLLSLTVLPDENHFNFERKDGQVVYKETFAKPTLGWLLANSK